MKTRDLSQGESKKPVGQAREPGADPKLALCLAGGGGLGFLHVGLFEALEELGLKPGVVAGTSSGAVAGAMYASGMSVAEMRKSLADFRWVRAIAPAIPRRGLLSTVRMQAYFRSEFGSIDLSELPLKLIVAAVDLLTGELKGFETGPLEKCLAASCAIPGFFEPVMVHGRMYYDAGGIYNLPLELLSGRGLSTIIAGNTIGEKGLMKNPKTVQETLYQAYLIRTKHLTAWRTGPDGWKGRTKEKLVLIDYPSEGVNPKSLADAEGKISEVRELSLSVLRKAFQKQGREHD